MSYLCEMIAAMVSVIKGRILFLGTFYVVAYISIGLLSCSNASGNKPEITKLKAVNKRTLTKENKMKVEIWSDVLCPFCYIGKRNFEAALEQFKEREHIEIVWKSYQLAPGLPAVSKESYQNYLAAKKGMSLEQVNSMLENIVQSAKEAGLEYNFDKAIMANSLNAHKLIQYAKTKSKGDEAEERLFLAYFTEGKNIGDLDTLIQLGKEIGLDEKEVKTIFIDEKYADLVKQDILEAQQVGVQGVPFFVLDRKYAVSGAQPAASFLEGLKQAFAEWREANPITKLKVTEGQSCNPDGICE